MISLVGEKPTLLRPGAITLEELQSVLGDVRLAKKENAKVESPGMLTVHYSPRTRVEFLRDIDLKSLPQRVGLILFSDSVSFPRSQSIVSIRRLSSSGDYNEIASKLFLTLRELDSKSLDLILVDSCSDEGLGRAIMDRLLRATNG